MYVNNRLNTELVLKQSVNIHFLNTFHIAKLLS